MSNEETGELAKLLVQKIRDMAIKSCDVQLYADNMRAPTAKRCGMQKTIGMSINLQK